MRCRSLDCKQWEWWPSNQIACFVVQWCSIPITLPRFTEIRRHLIYAGLRKYEYRRTNYFAKCAIKLFHNMNAIGRSLIGMLGGVIVFTANFAVPIFYQASYSIHVTEQFSCTFWEILGAKNTCNALALLTEMPIPIS